MPVWAAVALGGTKSTVAVARQADADAFEWVSGDRLSTTADPDVMLARLADALAAQLAAAGRAGAGGEPAALAGIGIVCGSPLDEQAGLVLAPPNLPRWREVDVLTPFATRFGLRPALLNDADAGALAEWAWGAGQGASNVVFLTMGTGLGAGLILGGRLYRGRPVSPESSVTGGSTRPGRLATGRPARSRASARDPVSPGRRSSLPPSGSARAARQDLRPTGPALPT